MSKPTTNEIWNEFKEAIKSKFHGSDISEEVKVLFFKIDKDTISLVFKGIDNEYETSFGTEEIEHWEVYLKKDGTWKIT